MRNIQDLPTYNDFRKELMKDPKFRVEYKKLEHDPEFAFMDAMVKAQKKGMTQSDIAKNMGTSQSAISRALSGSVDPSIDFLDRFARAIGMRLEIRFRPL